MLGIDIGRTKIEGTDGSISKKELLIDITNKNIFLKQIIDFIKQFDIQHEKIIGVSFPGPMDYKKGLIINPPNLESMWNTNLKEILKKHFDKEFVFIGGTDASMLAEIEDSKFDNKTILGITLGTNIGLSLIQHKKPLVKSYIYSNPFKEKTVQEYISGEGLSNIYFELSNHKLDAEEIAVLANNHDRNALKTFETFGIYLAQAIIPLLNLIHPEYLILTASVSKSYDLFKNTFNSTLKKYLTPKNYSPEIIIAKKSTAYGVAVYSMTFNLS